jgi:outer membrane autotransporter protein
VLSSDLADQAYLAAAIPAGVRDLWRQGAQSVSSHLAATDNGESDGLWLQAVGGDFDGTSQLSHARGARELEWQGDYSGVQGGFEASFGALRAGVTGGFSEASMNLGGAEETTLDSVNAGVYAQWERAGFFVTGLVRGERVDVESEWGSIGLDAKGDGSTVGLALEGGYRFDIGNFYLEPHLRVSAVSTNLPEQQGRSGSVHWDDSTVASTEVGMRFGVVEGWHGIRPYASMSFAQETGDGDQTIYDLGSETVRVSDEGERAFGRFAGGVEWTVGRFDIYAEAEGRVGDMEGISGRMGARLRF